MSDLNELIKALNNDYQGALKANDNAAYSKFAINLADSQTAVREYIQGITKDEVHSIVKKLINDEKLSKFEIDYIRLWLVSDAEEYVKHENDFEHWKNESKRLVEAINGLNKPGLNFEEATRLQALLLDLTRTTSDINFYLQQKERVEKFNTSVEELDTDERELLVYLLTSKHRSKEF